MRYLKEDYKTAAKAIVSSVKKHWSCKWPDERLEHSFGNVGPIKYKIGDCIKKLTFLGLHGVCGVNTRSALQIKAKNI